MENRRKPAPTAATLDINCDCKEAIVDYLTRAFPTRQMEEYVDELGDVRSRPMWDEAGNPVHNPQAEAARATAKSGEPTQTDGAPAKPVSSLPKIQLVSRAESTAPARSSTRPPTANAPSQPQPAPPAPASGGVVAGSYALQENASALRDYYRSQNIRAAVESIMVNGRPMYRVRIWR